MKKRLKKILLCAFSIGLLVSVICHLYHGEKHEIFNPEFANTSTILQFRNYIKTPSLSSFQIESQRNYDESFPKSTTFKENEKISFIENDGVLVANYSIEVETSFLHKNTSSTVLDGVLMITKEDAPIKKYLVEENKRIETSLTNNLHQNSLQVTRKSLVEDRDKIKQEFERRQQIIERVCAKYNVHTDSKYSDNKPPKESTHAAKKGGYTEHVLLSNFHLARSASSMTCLINKVASTTMAENLLRADGRKIPEWNREVSPHNAVVVLQPETEAEFNFARRHFFKFLLVRHPFERLLSAYIDKVEKADHWSLKEFRKEITKTVREVYRRQDPKNNKNNNRLVNESILGEDDQQYPLEGDQRDAVQELMQTENHPLSNHQRRILSVDKSVVEVDNQLMNDMEHESNIQKLGRRKAGLLDSPNFRGAAPLLQRRVKDQETSENSTVPGEQKIKILSNMERGKAIFGNTNKMNTGMAKGISGLNATGQTFVSPDNMLAEDGNYDGDIPTFSDFLEYILITNFTGMDFSSHWTPYWERCSPCTINYDVIAKLETADTDLKTIYGRLGIPMAKEKVWYNRSAGPFYSREDMLYYYYRELDPLLVARVYRRYALDFHLLEYDIKDVFRLAGFCTTPACHEMSKYV